jgi:hypothetical protein
MRSSRARRRCSSCIWRAPPNTRSHAAPRRDGRRCYESGCSRGRARPRQEDRLLFTHSRSAAAGTTATRTSRAASCGARARAFTNLSRLDRAVAWSLSQLLAHAAAAGSRRGDDAYSDRTSESHCLPFELAATADTAGARSARRPGDRPRDGTSCAGRGARAAASARARGSLLQFTTRTTARQRSARSAAFDLSRLLTACSRSRGARRVYRR